MKEMIETFIDCFSKNGVPVFGTAESWRFEDADAGHRPCDVLPGAASVLCFGVPVPKGLLQNRKTRNKNYWRIASIYYQKLDQISSQIAVLLEGEGHLAMPILS